MLGETYRQPSARNDLFSYALKTVPGNHFLCLEVVLHSPPTRHSLALVESFGCPWGAGASFEGSSSHAHWVHPAYRSRSAVAAHCFYGYVSALVGNRTGPVYTYCMLLVRLGAFSRHLSENSIPTLASHLRRSSLIDKIESWDSLPWHPANKGSHILFPAAPSLIASLTV